MIAVERIVRSAAALLALMLACGCSRGGSMPAAQPSQGAAPTGSVRSDPASTTPAAVLPPPMPSPLAEGGEPVAPAPRPSRSAPGAAPSLGTGSNQPVMQSGTANPFDEHGGVAAAAGAASECARDEDCVCGIDRSTGACAVGPAGRVDTGRQCPDFCAGVGGQLHLVCDRGRCTQR